MEEEEEEDDDEEDEEEDDFVPRRRRESSSDEQANPPKRSRYSPSAPNGYARASPPAASTSHPQPRTSVAAPAPVEASPLRLPPPNARPSLEHSILNVEPVDEFIREVADFVHRLVANRTEHIEVEAKIGVLRDGSGQRIRLPIGVETTLSSDMPGIRFESNMSASQHHHYNTLLNNLGVKPPSTDIQRTPLKYNHARLLDSFYPAPDGSREKLRVTIDEMTGKVVQCIRKVRLGDLNIHSPKRNADWRISVNLEIPSPQPAGAPSHTRKKDRITYTHQYCNVDLTQVRQSATPSSPPTVLHELELEFNPTAVPILLHSASRRNSPDPSLSQEQRDEFDEIIRIFVNNARILVRNASNAWEGH
ncbi:mRNA triphosphatase CET1 [Ramaria rubella]|nr:mRNA triphosphatase CET1 [Ramaria rubella]